MKEDNKNIEFLKAIGRRIRHFRNKNKLSQEKFSFECNLHRTYIGAIERGEKNITITNLKKISDTLQISIIDLFNFDDNNEES